MSKSTEEDVRKKFNRIVSEQVDVDVDDFRTKTLTEIGLDSLDMIEIIMSLEEEFDVSVDDELEEKIQRATTLEDAWEIMKPYLVD